MHEELQQVLLKLDSINVCEQFLHSNSNHYDLKVKKFNLHFKKCLMSKLIKLDENNIKLNQTYIYAHKLVYHMWRPNQSGMS
jgi:hypothetical protein